MGICTKLPKVASCCCGCTLRTGTLILAWFYVIGSALSVASSVTLFVKLDKNSTDYDYNLMYSNLIVLMIAYSCQLLLGLFLLIGATQNKPNMLLPYLWLQAFVLILELTSVIFAFVVHWFTGIGPLLSWLLALYFFMVVNSFYQQLKRDSMRPQPAI